MRYRIVEPTIFGKELMNALSQYIQAEMARQGKNLTDLAAAADVPMSTLSRYVNGTVKNPRASVLAKIARGLGSDWAMMMDLAGLTTGIPERDRGNLPGDVLALLVAEPWLLDVVRRIGNLPPSQQRAVTAYLRHLLAENDSRSPPGQK
jgi:transcriptional regulator with XRE-family HTH domain